MLKSFFSVLAVIAVVALASCGGGGSSKANEDKQAKQMLQGVWTNDEDGEAAILVRGDSIFYPDTASMPVAFWIEGDSIYLEGSRVNAYHITKQAPHLFKFNNQNGDEVKLVKSDDKQLRSLFNISRPYAMNTFRTEDEDTTVSTDAGFFNLRIHTETTSDRVVKSSYNDYGVEVDNLYLDNMARLTITSQGSVVYTHDFRKMEFQQQVSHDIIEQSILRSITFTHADSHAFYFDVSIGIPDASTTYVISLRITPDGRVSKELK